MVDPDRDRLVGLPTRYRVGHLVGRGSSAAVYAARDAHTGRDVVVKVLYGAPITDGVFEAESRALGRLAGVPGVVAIEAVGRTRTGVAWLVEDRLIGGTLAEALRDAPWSPSDVLALARDLGGVVARVHAAGVIHGDLSPRNVLLDANGTVVVCDFGVAQLYASGGPTARSGESDRSARGFTPSFAAPERRQGGPPTAASDVYSLAALVFYAATGSVPAPDRPWPNLHRSSRAH
ncbi:MAG: serine/threonine-protein kinase, partial [Actinomycetes bacterium]